MDCMKCAKAVSGSNIFCDECLAEMEQYPVKPGTAVLLPNRPTQNIVHKRSARRTKKPEEQISTLKKWVTFFCVFCSLLIVALTLSILLNLHLLGEKEFSILPGQNYRCVERSDSNIADTQP